MFEPLEEPEHCPLCACVRRLLVAAVLAALTVAGLWWSIS